jgi:DNA-binding NarL/FixJ family response regulator
MQSSKGARRIISVVLADDHDVIRLGLRMLLRAKPGFEVVGEAASGREAVSLGMRLKPSVVVMDLGMPLLNGMEATRRIVDTCPRVRVVALSSYGDREHVRQALAAGVTGYVLKTEAAADLLVAIREVHSGRRFYSPSIARQLHKWGMEVDAAAAGVELTSREAEVLQLVAEGQRNQQIAKELEISLKAVREYRRVLLRKLELNCLADLVRHAVCMGAIENDRDGEWGENRP